MVSINTETVFYIIYVIYLFLNLWDLYIDNYYILWGIVIILFILIFIVYILITLHIDGFIYEIKLEGTVIEFNTSDGSTTTGILLNSVYLTIMIISLVLILGVILYYQYNSVCKVGINITKKINNKTLTPLNYQYGRDSQEIGIKLQIVDNEILREPKSLQEIIGIIMKDNSNKTVKKLLTKTIGCELVDTPDVCYDLLWYLFISEDPFRNNLTKKERSYVLKASRNELQEILGDRYNGASDRASMIFTILSGQIIPAIKYGDTEFLNRYKQIKSYNSDVVYNLAFVANDIMIDHNNGTYNVYGPYTNLSLYNPSPIESIISNTKNEDFMTMIEKLGIGPIFNLEFMTDLEKIKFLQGEISLYHNVFNRDTNIGLPPNLINKNRNEIINIILKYTNIELINAYEPRGRWNSRAELIKLICDDILDGPKWSIHSIQYCTNDDTINVITAESHGETDKHNINDPTLSYGVHKNYRCYQASELEGSFRDYDGIFMFRVPDWIPNTNYQPKEFPIETIKQLKSMLEHEQERYNIKGLITKIQQGLDRLKSANMHSKYLKQQLSQLTFEQKQTIELYLAWMFTYAMWMRFWKGPGYSWPLRKVNVKLESERKKQQRSSPRERDEYIFIQESVRTTIIEMYENDVLLNNWIVSLPTIYYDFETGDATCATHNIKETLDKIAIGDYCMGFGSDTILKTAYYYIINVLDYSPGNSFNNFIESKLPQLLDLEYSSIINQLNSIHTESFRSQILNNRLHILQQPIPKQPPFDPSNYQNNVHINN